jgi:hypothetical protein
VDDEHDGFGDAYGHGREHVPSSIRAGGGAVGGCAAAVVETQEVAEGGLKSGGNACPMHNMAQNPVRMSWRSVVRAARVVQRMPWLSYFILLPNESGVLGL